MYQKRAGTCVLLVHIYCRPKLSNSADTQVLPETLGRGFEVNRSFRIDKVVAPLREVLPMAFWFAVAASVEVLRLTVHCMPKAHCLWIQPYRAEPAMPQRKAAGEAGDATDSDDHGRSSGYDGGPHTRSDLSQSNKDI